MHAVTAKDLHLQYPDYPIITVCMYLVLLCTCLLVLHNVLYYCSADAQNFRVNVQLISTYMYVVSLPNGDCACTELGVGRHWWFKYPGPLLIVELEFACLSGVGYTGALALYCLDLTQPAELPL